ncbi:transient receptor potential cation channel subfamily M member 2-like [Corticium candelabrum]|uniref:transient receptor potential cation channel subfamily M member 2-like n=1 Tax=Corticium candelabrum TaxID=121492 RepID=UPI002E25C3EF|nr:transient receptor potential cation channel subfamily M member 2-like [Corticium candelabrum]
MSDFVAVTDVESLIGRVIMSLWLLIGVIVLVNLLVAMVTNAFQKVQDHSDVEWKFARATLLFEVRTSPIFVPPFNIFYYAAVLVAQCLTCCSRRHEGTLYTDAIPEDNVLELAPLARSTNDVSDADKKALLNFLRQTEKEQSHDHLTTVRDLQRLEEKLDAVQKILSTFCSYSVTCPHCHQLVSVRDDAKLGESSV